MKMVLTNNWFVDEIKFDSLLVQSDKTVYEVIRVIDGISLFLEDHFERLLNSMKLQDMLFDVDFKTFQRNLLLLIRENNCTLGNVKFIFSIADNAPFWAFSFIPHSYPTEADYQHGVDTQLLFAERQTPNAKVIQPGLRDRANAAISAYNLYEVLLVDNNGWITEGSRSNVFFVKNDVFYTAPASMVLEGITRNKLIECIKELGFGLKQQAVHYTEISEYEAVFISGTSPKVLPVKSIGTDVFEPGNAYVSKLASHYNLMIQEYVQQQK